MNKKTEAMRITREMVQIENQITDLKNKLHRLEKEFEAIVVTNRAGNEYNTIQSSLHHFATNQFVDSKTSFSGQFYSNNIGSMPVQIMSGIPLTESDSIAKKLKSFFYNHQDQEVSLNEIQQLLPDARPHTLRATVSRLVNKDKVLQNTNRGFYKYLDKEFEGVSEVR